MKVVAEVKAAHRKTPVKIAIWGTILGGFGTGLSASTSAAALINRVPVWVVFAGGMIICACVTIASIIRHWHDFDDTDDAGA